MSNMDGRREQKKSQVKVRVIERGTGSIPLPEMVMVPFGEFLMGTSDEQVMFLYHREDWAQEWKEDGNFYIEQPMHIVELPSFEIGKYPVTNLEYYRFVWEVNYRIPRGWSGFRYEDGLDKHPVVGITYYDAIAYIEWLNKKPAVSTGCRPKQSGNEQRAARTGEFTRGVMNLIPGAATRWRADWRGQPRWTAMFRQVSAGGRCGYGWQCLGMDQQPAAALSVPAGSGTTPEPAPGWVCCTRWGMVLQPQACALRHA